MSEAGPECEICGYRIHDCREAEAECLRVAWEKAKAELAAERAWRARVVPLLYDCIAETDSLFQETLLRRLDEEVNAAKLLPPVSPSPHERRLKGEKT